MLQIVSAVGTAVVIIFFALYRPNYKRSILERRNQKQSANLSPNQGQVPKEEIPLSEVDVEPNLLHNSQITLNSYAIHIISFIELLVNLYG
uniref:Uncharacterized protein n=1 Tax=Ascaris lumbricoides TaxID=6252 RepID=A0A0M3IR84_ASCLU